MVEKDNSENRKSGHYWVSYEGEWRVAEFIDEKDSHRKGYGGVWGLVGKTDFFYDRHFDEINETTIKKHK